VNCVILAYDLFNCGFIYYCHVRYVELYGSYYVIWFGVFIVFEDIVLMDFDRYQCIFRSTTIVFKITEILAPYSFPTISYRFQFRKKK
jgi:hypothetical protein